MGSDSRILEEMTYHKEIKPDYVNRFFWELYCEDLQTEYNQSIEEGLDISRYKEVFDSVSKLPRGEMKKKLVPGYNSYGRYIYL